MTRKMAHIRARVRQSKVAGRDRLIAIASRIAKNVQNVASPSQANCAVLLKCTVLLRGAREDGDPARSRARDDKQVRRGRAVMGWEMATRRVRRRSVRGAGDAGDTVAVAGCFTGSSSVEAMR